MPHRNVRSNCTAQRGDGSFCDAQSLPESPFPICLHHAAEVVRYVSQVASTNTGVEETTTALGMVRTYGMRASRWRELDLSANDNRPRVYYIRLGGLIKIGTSSDLLARLRKYPPMAELLAVEAGGRDVEGQRHEQFAHLRQFRKNSEWFKSGPDLEDHIAALRLAAA